MPFYNCERGNKVMNDEMMMAKDLFGDILDDHPRKTRMPRRKASCKGKELFEEIKIRMVMKIENCGRDEAVRLIAVRTEAEAQRARKDEPREEPPDFFD